MLQIKLHLCSAALAPTSSLGLGRALLLRAEVFGLLRGLGGLLHVFELGLVALLVLLHLLFKLGFESLCVLLDFLVDLLATLGNSLVVGAGLVLDGADLDGALLVRNLQLTAELGSGLFFRCTLLGSATLTGELDFLCTIGSGGLALFKLSCPAGVSFGMQGLKGFTGELGPLGGLEALGQLGRCGSGRLNVDLKRNWGLHSG